MSSTTQLLLCETLRVDVRYLITSSAGYTVRTHATTLYISRTLGGVSDVGGIRDCVGVGGGGGDGGGGGGGCGGCSGGGGCGDWGGGAGVARRSKVHYYYSNINSSAHDT